MNEPALVSIGVPTCNRAGLLSKALGSLASQDYRPLELIVSDNSSTDDTPALCARFKGEYPFIRYHRQPERVPAQQNFNTVLGLARGRYFMWAADDDLWEPTFVSRLAGHLEADPELALAMTEAQYQLADGTRLPFFPEGASWYHPTARTAVDRLFALADHNYGNLIYGLYRREVLLTPAGTLLDGWKSSNEIPLFLRIAARGSIQVCREVLFRKTIDLPTYLSAAREYGFFPARDQLPPADKSGARAASALARGFRAKAHHRLRTLVKMPKKAIADFKYHFRTSRDIGLAIDLLDLAPEVKRDLRRAFATRLARHYLRTVVGWTLQDIFLPDRRR